MKKRYSLTDSNQVLPPPSHTRRLIREAERKVRNGKTNDGLHMLVETLKKDGLKYSILEDNLGCVIAISFHDPILARTPHEACAVYTSEVTFGITESASGFGKWYFLVG